MYKPPEKPPDPPQYTRERLQIRKSMPMPEDLRGLFAEAQKYHGKVVELPFQCANETEMMVLTVELKIGDAKPIWTLYHGDGPGSKMVWHCTEHDFELISDVISMFVLEVEKAHYNTAQPVVDATFREPEVQAAPPPQPSAAPSPAPAAPTYSDPQQSYFQNIQPVDFDLMKKQSNVLLGYMLLDAGFISEAVLESALKLQEMVRNDVLTPVQACETLRRTHARESSIPPQQRTTQERKKEEVRETQLVVELLKKAGLVTEADMEAVIAVKKKHGGDIGSMLVSSGKVEKATFEAATTCWPLVRDGKMKPEQAIIALHYCQRTRLSFNDAIDELGWERPQ